MKNSGIYKIVNTKNGKVYVGSSKKLKHRKVNHFWRLRTNQHQNSYLQKAFNKYGADYFVFEILEELPIDKLEERELYFINLYDSLNKGKGYNLLGSSKSVRDVGKEIADKISKIKSTVLYSYDVKTGEVRVHTQNNKRPQRNFKQGIKNNNVIKGCYWFYDINLNTLKKCFEQTMHRAMKKSKKNFQRICLDTETGIYHDSMAEASRSIGLNRSTFNSYYKKSNYYKNRFVIDLPKKFKDNLLLNLETGIFYSSIEQASTSVGLWPTALSSGLKRNNGIYKSLKLV